MKNIIKAVAVAGLLFSGGVADPPRVLAQVPTPAPGPQNLRLGAYVAKFTNGPGVTVTRVVPGKPASRIIVRRIIDGEFVEREESLVPGDLILFLDGQPVNSPEHCQWIIYTFPAGETLWIKGRDGAHGGKTFTAWVVLDE